jgi:hypothetical protein
MNTTHGAVYSFLTPSNSLFDLPEPTKRRIAVMRNDGTVMYEKDFEELLHDSQKVIQEMTKNENDEEEDEDEDDDDIPELHADDDIPDLRDEDKDEDNKDENLQDYQR